MRAEARFLYNNPYFYLFSTAQDTIFFVLVVDSLAGIAALRAEIEVAMEVENEYLTEIIVAPCGLRNPASRRTVC